MITEERKKELIEEAEGLYCSMSFHISRNMSDEESTFFWKYVYDDLGYDSCDCCGCWYDMTTFDENGYCEGCSSDIEEEEYEDESEDS